MRLVEKHSFKKNHIYFKELDTLCFLSKNLYNATLYEVRQHYFEHKKYLNYYDVNKQFTHSKQADYIALPAKVSKMTQQLVDKNFTSFFKAIKSEKMQGKKVRIPWYLDKKKWRQIVQYPWQALSTKKRKWYIWLSKTNIFIKTDKDVKAVRIVHKWNHINVELIYEIEEQKQLSKNGRFASIDLWINNLATITSNVCEPFIINGRPLKSINQFCNKKSAQYQSISKKTTSLWKKRNNKIDDYLHKSSRLVVNHIVSNNIDTLVIWYNKGWKQEITIGKRNNQKFVMIPFLRFVEMLEYKCKLVGIEVVRNEESYTSKCSFLDNEEVKKHENYLWKRKKRWLFVSSEWKEINISIIYWKSIFIYYLLTVVNTFINS